MSKKGNTKFNLVFLLVLGIFIVWLLVNMAYVVAPEEQGIIRRFGAVVRQVGPGLHFKLPYPIEKLDLPKVTEVRRIEIGFRTIDPGPPATYRNVPEESLMLTGDENIVNAEIIVQYKIVDAIKYLFNVRDVENTLKDASESALRGVIADHSIDEALTTGKTMIAIETQKKIQTIMDLYDAGILIITVQLQDVLPPTKAVNDAFKDVANAREDKNRMINEAQGYEYKILPQARGDAERIIKNAEAYEAEIINAAKGETQRFIAMQSAYSKAKDITKIRMLLDTYEKILPGVKKYIMSSGGKSGNLLNILQLNDKEGGTK